MTEIVKALSFEERLKEKIKTDIGELMTDADLKKIVDAAVQDVFFKTRKESSHYNSRELPPLLHELVQKALEEKVLEAIKSYIVDHKEEVEKLTKDFLAEGFGKLFMHGLASLFRDDLYKFSSDVNSRLSNIIR